MAAPYPGKWVRVTDQPPPWKISDNAWEWMPIKVLPKWQQFFCRHMVTYFGPPSERYCEKCGKLLCNVVWL